MPSPSQPNEHLDVTETPELLDPDRTEQELISFVAEVVDDAGADGVVVCLNGGTDSTVSAMLAVEALHRHDVYGLLLPAAPTLDTDVEDARSVAKTLGIDHRVLDIQPILDRFVETAATDQRELKPDPFRDRVRRITTSPVERENYRGAVGNTAARIRTSIAYFEANTTNRLVLGTGSRTEFLLGSFTKYGGADLLPIGDLYETEIHQLADHLGAPTEIVEKPPTAGVWAGQPGEEELGTSYATIDSVLVSLVDEGRSVDETASSLDLNPTVVAQYAEMVERSAHKRHPPVTPSERDVPLIEGGDR